MCNNTSGWCLEIYFINDIAYLNISKYCYVEMLNLFNLTMYHDKHIKLEED